MTKTNNITRNTNTLTYVYEKRLLDAVCRRICKYFNADFFSGLALFGAIVSFYAYWVAGSNLFYLHLANFGIFLHWFGDSMDGRSARMRKESRPNYGHYLDHILDSISLVAIVAGIYLSGITLTTSWLFALIVILLLFNHVYLRTTATTVFDLAIDYIGGTEIRIIMVAINLLVLSQQNPIYKVFVGNITLMDLVGYVVLLLVTIGFVKSVATSLWGKDKIRG